MAETLWVDRSGAVLKRRIAGMEQESYRMSEKQAKAEAAGGPSVDIGTDMFVKIEPALARAHALRWARYRVELASGDPAKAFAQGANQVVKRLGPHAAELTVTSSRLGHGGGDRGASPAASPGAEYTTANSVLQIDDPRIRAMAAQARGAETDPLRIAMALERFVHDQVSASDFTQALATAAEVAQSRRGDCTEHAVLLAALGRACGIPSRVAIGLVYVERAGGFGYHMWSELYVNGQWLPFDATLGQGGIGAAHLKLVDASFHGTTGYNAFLPVAQVVGQLQIHVLETE
jgi:transglutaminase-like putative cysteine protease